MSEQLKESLSAVMDGEADEFEIRRVLDEATDDAALRGVWERYHLIGSVLRGEGRTLSASSLSRSLGAPDSSSFWARIDADGDNPDDVEPMLVEPEAAPGNRWMQRIVGVAVAAGVAAAVVIGFGHNNQSTSGDAAQVAQVQPGTVSGTEPVSLVGVTGTGFGQSRSAPVDGSLNGGQFVLADPEPVTTPVADPTEAARQPSAAELQRLNAYMLHHIRQAALTNQRGVPFVKVAAFESSQ